MKCVVPFLFTTMVSFLGAAQVVDGSSVFSTNCAACHTIGKGKLVGPDLKGVMERYEKPWIARFIRESQAMVAEGDEKAVATFNANFMIPMPNVPLSDEEIDALLVHIANVGGGDPDPPKPVVSKPKTSNVPKITPTITSGVSKDQRDATFKSMMTGFWIALSAFTAMGIGIWYSTKKQ